MGKMTANKELTWEQAGLEQRAVMLCNVLPGGTMDQDKLKKLLEVADPQDQLKLKVLYNAIVKGIQDYNSASTSAHLKDWRNAETELDGFIDSLWSKQLKKADPGVLPNIADVLAYLQESGWKVTRTSLYRHHKEGKLAPRADGAYTLRDVDKYARAWLKQQSTGRRLQEKTEDLQRRKLEMELKNLELENKRKTLAYDKEIGCLIPREHVEIELAGRAGILDAGLKHWIQSRAAEWIRLTDGDTGKVGELINIMIIDAEEHLNSYAAPIEYRVVIDTEGGEDSA